MNQTKMNLGRIVFLFFLPLLLFAKVTIEAPKSFFAGEAVVFTIKAQGENVKLPNISKIEDFLVQNGGTSSSTTIINGQRSQSISKSYVVRANRSFTIPSFEVKVDGKIKKTKPVKVVKKQVQKTISKDYSLDISVNKKELFVGQGFEYTIKLKYKNSLNLVDMEFFRPNFENFWAKELGKATQKNEGEFVVHELKYMLFPQKSGQVKLESLRINLIVAKSSMGYGIFSRTLTDKIAVYSNNIELNIKPLPKGVELIGDFEISSNVDKKSVKDSQGVSYTLTINGRGNIDDIQEIKLDIPNAVVYENPSKKEYNFQNGVYGGNYSKSYSIIASDDFTIPSIKLKYFDKKEQKVKTIQTKAYDIKVQSKVKKEPLTLQTKKSSQSTATIEQKEQKMVVQSSLKDNILFFLLGVVVSLTIMVLYIALTKKTKSKKEDTVFEKSIKKAKTHQELFKLLVVYINIDEQLDKIIFQLESQKNLDLKSIKKEIIKLVKDKKLQL